MCISDSNAVYGTMVITSILWFSQRIIPFRLIWGGCTEFVIPSKCSPILKVTIIRMLRRPLSSYIMYHASHGASLKAAKVGIVYLCVEVFLVCVELLWAWDGCLLRCEEDGWEHLVDALREKEASSTRKSCHGPRRGGYRRIPTTDDKYEVVLKIFENWFRKSGFKSYTKNIAQIVEDYAGNLIELAEV